MIRGPGHAALVESVRDRGPASSGVYLFHGERNEILYVGKSRNLRQRVLAHLRQDPATDEPRHAHMIYESRGVTFHTTASELLALLREDELIKAHRPRFNVRQNEFLEYKYLVLTEDRFPRLQMVDHDEIGDGRGAFGPFRDRYLVDDLLRLIHRWLAVRSCRDPSPVEKCLEFDLGHCCGPCRGAVTAAEYGRAVAGAIAFLEGDESEVASRLQRDMENAATGLDFEKAQQLKQRLTFCRRFCDRQRFVRRFRKQSLVVVEKGDPGRAYLFRAGRFVVSGTAVDIELETASSDVVAPAEDPRFVLDRATLVHGWIRRNRTDCEYRFVEGDPEGAGPEAGEVARRAAIR